MKKRKYIKSPLRVAFFARAIAKLIDLFLVVLLSMFFYPLGMLLSLVYISISDALHGGQSLGKRLVGFSVISLEDGSPCSIKQSLIRNLPFSIPILFAIVPLWGWILAVILLFLPLVELYFLFKLDSGHRLGDVMADTSVIAQDGDRVIDLERAKNRTSWFEAEPGQN